MEKAIILMSLDKKVPSGKIPLLSEKFKNIPEEKVTEILAFSNLKDPLTSMLLGVFLGAIGIHNFYLKENKKGFVFASLFALSFIAMIALLAYELTMIMNSLVIRTGLNWGFILAIFSTILCIIVVIAGLIDGILSYKRTQEKNFNNILAAIESVK